MVLFLSNIIRQPWLQAKFIVVYYLSTVMVITVTVLRTGVYSNGLLLTKPLTMGGVEGYENLVTRRFLYH